MSGLITAAGLTSGTVTLDASGATPADTIHYSHANSFTSVATSNTVRKLVLSGSNTGNNSFNGAFTNNSGTSNAATLAKNGNGNWILTGTNAHTGITTINSGMLFINGDQTLATGNVSVAANATLGGTGIIGGNTTISTNGKLEFNLGTNAASHDKLELAAGKSLTFSGASTLTITSSGGASIGDFTLVTAPGGFGVSAPPATVILPPGWTADAPRFVGNDLKINVTTIDPAPSPYEIWSGGAAFDADANGDGVANGVAWVLGAANPNANAIDLLPTFNNTSDPDFFIFTYRRAEKANDDPDTIIAVQYGSKLSAWATAVAGADIIITPTHDIEPGIDSVQVKIRRTLAVDNKLFARLYVEKSP